MASHNVCKKKRLVRQARYRAKKSGIAFDLTSDDLDWPSHCPCFGIALDYSNNGLSAASPSLDRVDSQLGYVAGNVRVISWRANSLKKDASVRELQQLARWAAEEENVVFNRTNVSVRLKREDILKNHLLDHGYITPGIWLLTYGLTNGLAQRVCDLRKKGWIINTLTSKDDVGKNMVRYTLVSTPKYKRPHDGS